MQNTYELMLVLRTTLSLEQEKKVLEEIKNSFKDKGKILETKDMGKRLLAYPIKKEKEGNYRLLILELAGEIINSLSSKLNLKDEILRYLFVKKIIKVKSKEK